MTDSTDYSTTDLQEVLVEQRQIAIIWSIEDVQQVRLELNDDQSWEVLLRCQRLHDCNDGFTWLLIETVASDLFPESE